MRAIVLCVLAFAGATCALQIPSLPSPKSILGAGSSILGNAPQINPRADESSSSSSSSQENKNTPELANELANRLVGDVLNAAGGAGSLALFPFKVGTSLFNTITEDIRDFVDNVLQMGNVVTDSDVPNLGIDLAKSVVRNIERLALNAGSALLEPEKFKLRLIQTIAGDVAQWLDKIQDEASQQQSRLSNDGTTEEPTPTPTRGQRPTRPNRPTSQRPRPTPPRRPTTPRPRPTSSARPSSPRPRPTPSRRPSSSRPRPTTTARPSSPRPRPTPSEGPRPTTPERPLSPRPRPTTTARPSSPRPRPTPSERPRPTTSERPSSARPSTTTSERPSSARPSTTTSERPSSARPSTTSERPSSARPSTTSERPSSARPSTTSERPSSARPSTTTSERPSSARPSTTSERPSSAQPSTTTSEPSTTQQTTTIQDSSDEGFFNVRGNLRVLRDVSLAGSIDFNPQSIVSYAQKLQKALASVDFSKIAQSIPRIPDLTPLDKLPPLPGLANITKRARNILIHSIAAGASTVEEAVQTAANAAVRSANPAESIVGLIENIQRVYTFVSGTALGFAPAAAALQQESTEVIGYLVDSLLSAVPKDAADRVHDLLD